MSFQKMSAIAKVSVNNASTTVSISQSFESPLIEGNTTNYEIIMPEKNDCINDSILETAKEKKQRIAIRPARLQLLLDMEAKLKRLNEKKQTKLEALHVKEKSNLTAVNERVKRYTEAHRDEINARRRERRKLTKEEPKSNIIIIKRTVPAAPAAAAAPPPAATPIHVSITVKSSPTPAPPTDKSTVSFS